MKGLLVFIEMEQNVFFFLKKVIQNGWLKKKTHFPAPPILNIFSWKFHGLVLGLVKLIDAKGISKLTDLYRCQKIRSVLKLLGIYNFGLPLSEKRGCCHKSDNYLFLWHKVGPTISKACPRHKFSFWLQKRSLSVAYYCLICLELSLWSKGL